MFSDVYYLYIYLYVYVRVINKKWGISLKESKKGFSGDFEWSKRKREIE